MCYQVFKETADTEIPRLQEFLRELGVSKSRHTELLLRRLYLLLSKIKVHLSTSGTQVSSFLVSRKYEFPIIDKGHIYDESLCSATTS